MHRSDRAPAGLRMGRWAARSYTFPLSLELLLPEVLMDLLAYVVSGSSPDKSSHEAGHVCGAAS